MSYYSDFKYIFEKTVCIKLDRIKVSSKSSKNNERVTRSSKLNREQTEWVRFLNGIYNNIYFFR